MEKPEYTLIPEEFGYLVETAIRAAQYRLPMVADSEPVADGGPYTKAAEALRAHFGDDLQRFENAMSRFVALMHLFTHKQLQHWVRESSTRADAQDIHPAVIHAAAQMKLNKSGKFPERKFLAFVAALAEEQYQGLENWDVGTLS